MVLKMVKGKSSLDEGVGMENKINQKENWNGTLFKSPL